MMGDRLGVKDSYKKIKYGKVMHATTDCSFESHFTST